MLQYNVTFVKNLLSSNGQGFVCLQGLIAVEADSPDKAISAAMREFEHKQSVDDWRLRADGFEITPGRHDGLTRE